MLAEVLAQEDEKKEYRKNKKRLICHVAKITRYHEPVTSRALPHMDPKIGVLEPVH